MNKKETENVQRNAGQVNSQALKAVADIVGEAVNQATEEERARAERLAALEALRITTQTEVTPEEYALTVDGVGIFALRDLHAIKGKQKSGKSSVLKVMMAALLSGQQFRIRRTMEEPVVLFLDTEQKAEDVKLVIDSLKQMTQVGDEYIDRHLFLYNLRRLSYETLLEDTRLLIDRHRPQVVFIDGLVDYVSSFNDEVLSRRLIQHLLTLCDEFNCAIVNALHENKAQDDDNMRGHLGSVLGQKAANILRCQKKKGIITVSCPDSRHETMPQWNIMYDQEGHILDADLMHQQEVQAVRKQKAEQRQTERNLVIQQRLETALSVIREHSGCLLRNELSSTLMGRLGLSRPVVSKFISQMVKERKLFESGKHIMDSADTVLPL